MVMLETKLKYFTTGRRKRRGRGTSEGADGADGEGDAESDASDADMSADDDRPRKRGRPPASHRERIKGFTDQEVCESIIVYNTIRITNNS